MRTTCMTSWSLFPPQTEELEYDEMWSFVGKKEKHCDPGHPDDVHQGDNWDHVAFDPEHRLVVEGVPGKRTAENVETLVESAKRRTGDRLMNLLTSDEYPAYPTAILNAYGVEVTPPRTGKPGRPKAPYKVPPPGLNYATVHKTREKGRVVHVEDRIVFGDLSTIKAALERSKVSTAINTAFIERHNGTERNRNSRKIRKTCGFSKDWDAHESATYFTNYSYNFCWPVRTLGQRVGNRWRPCTPAMAAGLTGHVWSLREWLTLPAVQRN